MAILFNVFLFSMFLIIGGFITADTANDEFQNDGMNVKEDMEGDYLFSF